MTDGKKRVRALGLCSGGLDSMLSALVLRQQGIHVEWIAFEFNIGRGPVSFENEYSRDARGSGPSLP